MNILQRYRHYSNGREVDAVKLNADNAEYLEKLTGGVLVHEEDALDSSKKTVGLNVPTPGGMKRCSEGDYVIYSGGWFYVRPSMGFEMNHEVV